MRAAEISISYIIIITVRLSICKRSLNRLQVMFKVIVLLLAAKIHLQGCIWLLISTMNGHNGHCVNIGQ